MAVSHGISDNPILNPVSSTPPLLSLLSLQHPPPFDLQDLTSLLWRPGRVSRVVYPRCPSGSSMALGLLRFHFTRSTFQTPGITSVFSARNDPRSTPSTQYPAPRSPPTPGHLDYISLPIESLTVVGLVTDIRCEESKETPSRSRSWRRLHSHLARNLRQSAERRTANVSAMPDDRAIRNPTFSSCIPYFTATLIVWLAWLQLMEQMTSDTLRQARLLTTNPYAETVQRVTPWTARIITFSLAREDRATLPHVAVHLHVAIFPQPCLCHLLQTCKDGPVGCRGKAPMLQGGRLPRAALQLSTGFRPFNLCVCQTWGTTSLLLELAMSDGHPRLPWQSIRAFSRDECPAHAPLAAVRSISGRELDPTSFSLTFPRPHDHLSHPKRAFLAITHPSLHGSPLSELSFLGLVFSTATWGSAEIPKYEYEVVFGHLLFCDWDEQRPSTLGSPLAFLLISETMGSPGAQPEQKLLRLQLKAHVNMMGGGNETDESDDLVNMKVRPLGWVVWNPLCRGTTMLPRRTCLTFEEGCR
ncbi:hypothetical protein ACRALDRAFT_1095490, partial [Sodiomyces alcalophilus JCM 7366]|uniref:uncharacterized protein n=1 Tax=Sodiomyces alcalophilus JCM 7366 TaxID=591952 RepID=UPI0039B64A8B